jgi:hypothetical protein
LKHKNFTLLLILLSLGAGLLAACGGKAAVADFAENPYSLEAVEGTELNRVILTERAAERLGVETATVNEAMKSGEQRLVIPYSALVYDINGGTWVYKALEPLVYIRESVTVDYIEDDEAVLTEGPEVGTEVVTVAVAELYGADTGVGK